MMIMRKVLFVFSSIFIFTSPAMGIHGDVNSEPNFEVMSDQELNNMLVDLDKEGGILAKKSLKLQTKIENKKKKLA